MGKKKSRRDRQRKSRRQKRQEKIRKLIGRRRDGKEEEARR